MSPKVSLFLKTMRPVFSLQNKADMAPTNIELSRYLALFFAKVSKFMNCFYIFCGKSCVVMATTARHPLSVCGITHVLGLGSCVKMLWIYTFRIIAMVANKHTFRDFPVQQFPGIAMGQYSSESFTIAEPSVSTMVHGANPIPAFMSFMHMAEKSFLKWWDRIFPCSHDMPRLKTAFFSFNMDSTSTFTKLHNFVPPHYGLEHNTKLLGEI